MKTNLGKILFTLPLIAVCVLAQINVYGQACTPLGDQTTYGTNDVWRGYVYGGTNFTTYRGYITAGTAGNYAFDQNFGGSGTNFATNGCSQFTDLFSVRYKLTKSFTNQNITFTVSGDDGYRLSIDGGATWLINRWSDQSYTTTTGSAYMNGTYNLVLEYYENGGDNRITFSSSASCGGALNPDIYGTNNIWQAYIYEGRNFNLYKGSKTEGAINDANFDENFGGDNVTMNFLTCPINTENFSARFRLTRHMPAGTYVFTVGGDDGYRFSVDGGATWLINRWADQSYTITTQTVVLNGTHNMVLEYYENGGSNRISFTMSASLLPVKLTSFNARLTSANNVQLNWTAQSEENLDRYDVQRSIDGRTFSTVGSVATKEGNAYQKAYSTTDQPNAHGAIYYRLAARDHDGAVTYSSVVTVNVSKITGMKIYPTVVTGSSLYLEASEKTEQAKIELVDMNGRILITKTMNLQYGKQLIDLSALANAKGSYVIRVASEHSQMLKQLIIVQ